MNTKPKMDICIKICNFKVKINSKDENTCPCHLFIFSMICYYYVILLGPAHIHSNTALGTHTMTSIFPDAIVLAASC